MTGTSRTCRRKHAWRKKARGYDRLIGCRARRVFAALQAMSGARISAVGVGPGREQTVQVHDLL